MKSLIKLFTVCLLVLPFTGITQPGTLGKKFFAGIFCVEAFAVVHQVIIQQVLEPATYCCLTKKTTFIKLSCWQHSF